MDIKAMYEMIEKLTECAKCEFDKGIENVDTEEMSKVVDMIKDLSDAMYKRTLTATMQESDTDEIMDMFDRYGDARRYYNHFHYKNGHFAPKGSGVRKGYEEPSYRMYPEMYKAHEPEWYRDMDRKSGKLYYTEPMRENHSESRYDRMKRMYTETRELHKDNTPESKQQKMKSLEDYTKVLAEDISGFISEMSAEEKNLIRGKLQALAQKVV